MNHFDITPAYILNPKDHDYIDKLDFGFKRLNDAMQSVDEKAEKLSRELSREITDILEKNGISNVRNIEFPYGSGISIPLRGIKEVIKVNKLVEQYKKTRKDDIQEIEKQGKILGNLFEGYTNITLGLTEIEPLNVIEPGSERYYLTIAKADEVYTAFVTPFMGFMNVVIGKTRLAIETIESFDYLNEVKTKSRETGFNAYLSKNPSREIGIEPLIEYSIMNILEDPHQENNFKFFESRQDKEFLNKFKKMVDDMGKQ